MAASTDEPHRVPPSSRATSNPPYGHMTDTAAAGRMHRQNRELLIAHAYLSASPDDDDAARLVGGELEARGHQMWRTTSGIEDGEDWEDAAKEALDTCYALVVVISPHGARSPWVRREVEQASSDIPIVAVELVTDRVSAPGFDIPGSNRSQRVASK